MKGQKLMLFLPWIDGETGHQEHELVIQASLNTGTTDETLSISTLQHTINLDMTLLMLETVMTYTKGFPTPFLIYLNTNATH